MSAAELREFAAWRGTSVEEETTRAEAAGYTVTPDPKPAREVTLQSTLIPGAAEFVHEDIAPIVRGLKAIAHEARHMVAPQSATARSQRAADVVREAKAKSANQATVEGLRMSPLSGMADRLATSVGLRLKNTELRQVAHRFRAASDDENIAAISTYERTGRFPGVPQAYNDLYHESMKLSRGLLLEAYGPDSVGYIEHYVRHAFDFDTPADEVAGVRYITRSLSANKTPTRSRILDMPVEDALDDMHRRGIKVKLATANPEELRQWSLANAHRAAAFANAWNELREAKLVTFVPHTVAGTATPALPLLNVRASGNRPGRVPEGYVQISDRGAAAFYPSERGLGSYYADPDIARVLNNAVSKGFSGSPTVQGLRVVNNAMNQLQLGLSAFHLGGTAINAGAADAALGVRRVVRGILRGEASTVAEGGSDMARGVVPLASFARDLYRGRKIIEGLKDNDPTMLAFLEDALNPAGGRVGMDSRYRNEMARKIIKAWGRGNVLGAGIRLPFAVVEAFAKPLMEYAIPRVKLGVFFERARDIRARMPEATDAQLHRAYAAAWDQIDNMFGELVYDNGFWDRSGQDIAQLATRSVGWTGGSLRWGVGAAADVGRLARDLAGGGRGGGRAGGPPETPGATGEPSPGPSPRGHISDRLLDALVYPIFVAILGAVYMYLHTRKLPKTAKDFYYPLNGRRDPNGDPSRTSLPTYMKDGFAYGHDPITTLSHKQSPLLNEAYTLWTNEDYWGTVIADPDDPLAKRMSDRGRYLLEQTLPFTVTQSSRLSREGAPLGAKAESFFGMTKAPASVSRSEAEAYLHDIAPPMHRTHEQAEQAQQRRDLKSAVRSTKPGEVHEATETTRLSPQMQKNAVKTARQSPMVGILKSPDVSIHQALKAYELATPDERRAIRLTVITKYKSAWKSTPPDERPGLRARFVDDMQLPAVAVGF